MDHVKVTTRLSLKKISQQKMYILPVAKEVAIYNQISKLIRTNC